MRRHISLLLILAVYFVLGALFVFFTPPWQAPDEPAHYNYVRQLANGRFPVMEPGDYDQAYQEQVVGSGFDAVYDLRPFSYEDWQPPLYYLVLTPLFWLGNGALWPLRLASLLLGAGVVALAYATARRLFPERRWIAAGTAVFVAFLPQHLAIMASVNNDALAELLIAAILLLLVINAEAPTRRGHATVGLLLGLGFLSKGTVYPLAGLVALALLVGYRRDWRGLAWAAGWVFGPALALGALWWGRNLVIYGGWDVLGKATHDAVVVGQPRTAVLLADLGFWGAVGQFTQTTFRSFWGQFGWMALPMLHPRWLYPLLWLFSGAVVAGLVVQWVVGSGKWGVGSGEWGVDSGEWGADDEERGKLTLDASHMTHHATGNTDHAPRPLWLLPLLFLLTLAVHVFYNFTFIQHQGRYLFPALVPIGVGVMVGLGGWLRPFFPRSSFLYALLPMALGLALVALDLWAIFRVIIPNLG